MLLLLLLWQETDPRCGIWFLQTHTGLPFQTWYKIQNRNVAWVGTIRPMLCHWLHLIPQIAHCCSKYVNSAWLKKRYFACIEIGFFFHPTCQCFKFTSNVFKQSLIISFHSASVCAEWILLSVFSVCVLALKHVQSLPLVLQPSRGFWCYLCWVVCVTQVYQNGKIMGADTTTAQGGGGWATAWLKRKEELWRIYHHICTNVLARLVESSLSSPIT